MFSLRRVLMSRLPDGCTHEQYVLLVYLDQEDGITQRDLAERSYTNPNTVTAILKRLEADGLIRRVRHELDGRARRVSITAKGRRLRQKLMVIGAKAVEDALSDLSDLERDTLVKGLDKVAQAAEKALLKNEKE